MKLAWGQKRPGSILATSISLVAVFLTLVIGSMVYVQNTMSQARTERLRTSAEEAARSGLELVLGWAEANIDQETRLPKTWDSMTDGQVIDPISGIMENAAAATATISTTLTPGSVIGVKQNEYVVGTQGQYITTFKARIQQFRISDDMPRQYRIGVVGRVRKVQPASRAGLGYNNIDTNERESIVAERVIVAFVGKEVTSRYAALIDIDGVKNWVPGEVVTGPVHINRGYVDQTPWSSSAVDIATASGIAPAASVPFRDLRSTMMLYIEGEGGNVGFKAPSAPPADNVKKYPIFESQVTLTEIPGGSGDYKASDPATTAQPIAIKINGFNYHKNNSSALPLLNAYHDKIFTAGENSTADRYGGPTASTTYRGPLIVRQPIELPRSVRNALGGATGVPGEWLAQTNSGRWGGIPNGLYIPTPRFWALDTGNGYIDTVDVKADGYSFGGGQPAAGGIYIRGEVELMRFGKGVNAGVDDHISYYLFQVSDGCRPNGTGNRRTYGVFADRINKTLALSALAPGRRLQGAGGVLSAAGSVTLGTVMSAANFNIPINTTTWTPGGDAPFSFKIGDASATGKRAFFKAPQYSDFPFNGVVYVDTVKADPARTSDTNGWRSMATTGNILALGNLGGTAAPSTNKTAFTIDSVNYENVATYKGTTPAGPASKLTIMARGNIFIQNHLLVDGVYKQYLAEASQSGNVSGATATGAARTALGKIKLEHSRDVLGLVSDKQIVVGAAAPRPAAVPASADKRRAGVVIMAAIAGLGDPAYTPWNESIKVSHLSSPLSYVGSFTTEGLMQAYNQSEQYYINKTGTFDAAQATQPDNNANLYSAPGTANVTQGYPGNPIYDAEGYEGALTPLNNNPNIQGTRGRMIVFGSITQKKRGIVGQGNQSYDKDFVYDKRLLTIAPPIFPSSVNVQVRTQSPFSPDDGNAQRRLTYAKGAGPIKSKGDLDFLGATPAGATPAP